MIHDGDGDWDSSLEIGDGLCLTTSRDVLEAMARGEGPVQATVAWVARGGVAGSWNRSWWRDNWLLVPVAPAILFDLPLEQRWQAAAGSIGVDLVNVASHSGHA